MAAMWAGIASLAGSVYNAYSQNQDANNKAQMTEQELQQQFQDQIYGKQMDRAYTLEDRNSKIKAIDRWAGATPQNAKTFVPGTTKVAPGSEQLYDTSNLDKFDPSIVGDGSSSNPNSLIGYLQNHATT